MKEIMTRVSQRRRAQGEDGLGKYGWEPIEIDNTIELTLITAFDQISEMSRDSRLDARVFERAERPISYICDKLHLTPRQAVIMSAAMSMYYLENFDLSSFARYFDISPLKAMSLLPEINNLVTNGYIRCRCTDDEKVYRVPADVITAMQENRDIAHITTSGLTATQWFEAVDELVLRRLSGEMSYDAFGADIFSLIDNNPTLQFTKKLKEISSSVSPDDLILLVWCCNMLVSDDKPLFAADDLHQMFERASSFAAHRRALAGGSHRLMKLDLVQVAKSDGPRIRDYYELTPHAIDTLLSDLNVTYQGAARADVIEHDSIVAKELFYNAEEGRAISRLTDLLQRERFDEVCSRLQEKGFRSGFACLFHGAPGTGKTETVLQLARKTGRDLMQVNISSIKSMWVGESEKNIKRIFTRYRKLVEESEVAPILLFNEADAIIGQRLEGANRSVDKMENAIQNIILEELESLQGILIATTNLACNMDKAFERRFLYKVEFAKPSIEAKSSIWRSMIPELSETDAKMLAERYDFSGGQIENIARKNVVDMILTGEEMSVERLCEYCNTESHEHTSKHRRIGF